MANYFVDPVNGSDSNTATQAQNPATAWASFAHAIGAASFTMSGSGDTVWLIPYCALSWRNIALSLTPGTGNILTIQGDFDGRGPACCWSDDGIYRPMHLDGLYHQRYDMAG